MKISVSKRIWGAISLGVLLFLSWPGEAVEWEKMGQLNEHWKITSSLRARQELWHWFDPGDLARNDNNSYDFTAFQLRLGLKYQSDPLEGLFEVQDTRLLGLPGLSRKAGRFEYLDGLETLTGEPTLDWLKRSRINQRLIGPFGWQVFANLVRNAISAVKGASCPTIEVGYLDNGERLHHLYVRDNGIGIDPRHHQKIFEPFHSFFSQEGEEEGKERKGLGLAIVRKIVQAHGGEIWVESKPGQGASFHFTLRKN